MGYNAAVQYSYCIHTGSCSAYLNILMENSPTSVFTAGVTEAQVLIATEDATLLVLPV